MEACLEPDLRSAIRLQQSPMSSPPSSADTSALPPSYKDAFYGAIRRFLSLFVSKVNGVKIPCTQRPLVLFIDDVHWASAGDINFFSNLLLTDQLAGCMLIFAFRDNDGSDAFLDSDLRVKLCKS